MPAALVLDADSELVERVALGDEAAFEALLRRHGPPLRRLALRRLGSEQEAEDAVQETFAALWRGAAGYRPERGPGRGWLYGVARNAVYDRLRRRRQTLPVDSIQLVEESPPPGVAAELDWARARVHAAVRTLPAAQREPLVLAYWGGLTQREVALRLGLPLGTVKTRTRAALASLALALEELRDG